MEKESAEKATTESTDPVTSEETNSLAEMNEGTELVEEAVNAEPAPHVSEENSIESEAKSLEVVDKSNTDNETKGVPAVDVEPEVKEADSLAKGLEPTSEEIISEAESLEVVDKSTTDNEITTVPAADVEPIVKEADSIGKDPEPTSEEVKSEPESHEVVDKSTTDNDITPAPALETQPEDKEGDSASKDPETTLEAVESELTPVEEKDEVSAINIEVADNTSPSDDGTDGVQTSSLDESSGENDRVPKEEVIDEKTNTPEPVKSELVEVESETPSTTDKETPKKEDEKVGVKESATDEFKDVDFTTLNKDELVEIVKKLGKEENPFTADRILQQIAPLFNEIRAKEKKLALEKHLAADGTAENFEYAPDELSLRFDANYKLIKDKKSKKFKAQDKARTENLVLAEGALNELREFVDSEESSNSFTEFKVIQDKWRSLGDVPSQSSRTLWANYNALVHRFYDQRSIYFELKELDRKKNYEAKLILCDKVEGLEQAKNLREAIGTLNDLHHEFKHLGPVPKELQEDLWQRFKAASDKVYERRKLFVNELKVELNENLSKKHELIVKINELLEFDSDRIKEWNEKTKELTQLQKEWETIGGLPKDKAKHINKEFWSSFKQFFKNKHQFFKKLDAEREESLVKKQELVVKAEALKDNKEWEKTANEFKKLQSQWRDIGPVPEKMRKKIFEQFKASCDHFFNERRDGQKSALEDFKTNLRAKKSIISSIIGLKNDADNNLEEFNKLRKEFSTHGFVPKKNIDSIRDEFKKSVTEYLDSLTVLNIKEKTEISLETEFSGLANSDHSEKDLYHKEQAVRRQINKLEDEIALWDNNLEFFAHSKSKSTDKLREDVNNKIGAATTQVEGLKRQLKMIRAL